MNIVELKNEEINEINGGRAFLLTALYYGIGSWFVAGFIAGMANVPVKGLVGRGALAVWKGAIKDTGNALLKRGTAGITILLYGTMLLVNAVISDVNDAYRN